MRIIARIRKPVIQAEDQARFAHPCGNVAMHAPACVVSCFDGLAELDDFIGGIAAALKPNPASTAGR
jgi:hypothetical protein